MTIPRASPHPRSAARHVAPDLARLPIGLNLRVISLAEGIRAALSVAVIIAVNEPLQWPGLNEAALAALWTCLCDPGGPIRRRLPMLLSFTAIGAAITAGVGLRGASASRSRCRSALSRLFALSLCPRLRPGRPAVRRAAQLRGDPGARPPAAEPARLRARLPAAFLIGGALGDRAHPGDLAAPSLPAGPPRRRRGLSPRWPLLTADLRALSAGSRHADDAALGGTRARTSPRRARGDRERSRHRVRHAAHAAASPERAAGRA